jgi:hypothetical protein
MRCELIHENTITLRGLLLKINLQNESSLLVLLLISTVLTDAHQLIILLIQIEIEFACGTEIGWLHGSTIPYEFCPLQFYTALVGTSEIPMAIESDTRERFRAPVKIDRPKKGCRMV